MLKHLFRRRQVRVELQHTESVRPSLAGLSLRAKGARQIEPNAASIRGILKRRKPKPYRVLHFSRLCLNDPKVSLSVNQIGIDCQRLLIEMAGTFRSSPLLFNVAQR